jgi:hypothetical protein
MHRDRLNGQSFSCLFRSGYNLYLDIRPTFETVQRILACYHNTILLNMWQNAIEATESGCKINLVPTLKTMQSISVTGCSLIAFRKTTVCFDHEVKHSEILPADEPYPLTYYTESKRYTATGTLLEVIAST